MVILSFLRRSLSKLVTLESIITLSASRGRSLQQVLMKLKPTLEAEGTGDRIDPALVRRGALCSLGATNQSSSYEGPTGSSWQRRVDEALKINTSPTRKNKRVSMLREDRALRAPPSRSFALKTGSGGDINDADGASDASGASGVTSGATGIAVVAMTAFAAATMMMMLL